MSITINEELGVSDSLSWERTKTYFEKQPVLFPIVVVITIGSPFIGLFLAGWPGVFFGLVISIFSFLLGLKAVTKVIDREKGRGT
jgi:uncharacterized oligopeptide transporter (OPT) family protein